MRVNLTKKEIINSVFMQIGFSKKMSESILEDILSDIIKNLKKYKLTTRDSRVVERKKYGHRKARRSFQFSKR